jgi:pyruvate/2-oxoglutarate dehydrogenase complex dihydrolipoamide dehydrogenase (E3) component
MNDVAHASPDVSLLPLDRYNEILEANAHPRDWKAPEPASRYNLVVVGAGTAGLVSALGAAGLGARVALVEKRLTGGDCLVTGCVPSKALLRAARGVADLRDAGELGVVIPDGGARVDFPAVMERMRRLRATIAPNDSAARLEKHGIDVFFGAARFTARDAVLVDGKTLRFSRAVIATGARAAVPEIPGLREAGYLTNETIFALTELPRRLAIVGAGPIGCELAQAFARFGSRVTLVGRGRQLLSREDEDAAAVVARAFAKDGVEVVSEARVVSVAVRGGEKVLVLERAGVRTEVAADAILVAVGRTPNVDGLGLDAAGVSHDPSGIHVDDHLATANASIYAAGDVASRMKFTHLADAHARIVIENALFFGRARASALTVPWCTFTDPEVAHVGLSEKGARAQGIAIDTWRAELATVDRAVLDGDTDGFAKVHVAKGTDRILGATIVARHAGEIISEVTLAMANGLGLRAIGKTIHPYPTEAEALRRIADAYNRARLTPLLGKVLARWLAWRR